MTMQSIYGEPTLYPDSPERMAIPVNGVGEIHINRTDEGLIIDVVPAGDTPDSLASIALRNDDILESYAESVCNEVQKFDTTLSIYAEDVEKYFDLNYSVTMAANAFLANYQLDASTLTPLRGTAKEALGSIIDTSAPQINVKRALGADFVMTNDGRVMHCLEHSDGTMTLNHVKDSVAQNILAQQTVLSKILRSGALPCDVRQALCYQGFWVQSETESAYDFMYELTYSREAESSFVVNASFDLENYQLFLEIGTKTGRTYIHGLTVASTDSLIDQSDKDLRALVESELERLSNQDPAYHFYAVTEQQPKAFNDLKHMLDNLSVELHEPLEP